MSDLPVRDIARALVFGPRGRLLLIAYEAARDIDPERPGVKKFWFLPGGGVEAGETHEEALRRELEEEIGVTEVAPGPWIASCEGPFFLFRQPRFARERYATVRLPHDRIDTARLAETEDNPILDVRWWSVADLSATGDLVEPQGLAALAERVLRGDPPREPLALSWSRGASSGVSMFPQRLVDGYRAFLGERFPRERDRFAVLAEAGQRPEVMVIGCCDSRVSPEVIFDASPGELFVVRNVANLVPPYAPDGDYHGTSAALEFAVQALKVKHIVVLGHAHCGGILAFAEDAAPLSKGDFIGKWMTMIAPAAERLGPRGGDMTEYLARLERAAIAQSLANLMTFPYVAERVRQGRLALHGAYFGVASGVLLVRDPKTGAFQPAAAPPERAAPLSSA